MSARKIIIDTDPGHDDAFAILFALGSPEELEVVGITTVAGNVPLPLTSLNALKVVELAKRTDVPVYAGCAAPMVRKLLTAEHIHGETGIDGADLPHPVTPLQNEHAVNFIVRTLMEAPEGEITICTLGPMTNVAMAMTMEPRIIPRIREVVLMGGGFFEGGNTTPAAEFNIFVDPHAAHKVFASGVPVTMAGIDCTYTAQMTPEWLQKLRKTGSHAAVQAANLADFFRQYGSHKFPTEARPIHDACVTGYLLAPEIYEQRMCHVTVDISSPVTIGMTVVDWWGVTGNDKNCNVLRRVDADAFFALMLERIGSLP
ncbi:nucleoside hydrolase [Sulfitobacter pseudonitzschiae]|uniref:Nucleoside hydrolase n=1 Tax=Pseudosulfitobacter pseudonitzschiae TaxID=1402135 RepID=A0A9Q2NUN6_9RHOB|nr:nucleoside hydrolase [Pseudosulfitobacter pseudonitzschiae]MBM2292977.1 nucleoside hydrolase [Pseudosulfitobacter pseudonitzschiae]MBM2297735.1 nucleoside hydrolase [Pseudosulfitobacter pseudonitzschiae]MBM2302649.1 nucleoside hydrolase [Pseudosulfitobacter pseudonitzschiae]MBM2312361.1 nucleoside hydrolase [Pseudosulfitobacter pseudonitzschiae]MBM2317345.1 nucleoside hydrolase [Pseudosulfitobacter pseudonitzschiae]